MSPLDPTRAADIERARLQYEGEPFELEDLAPTWLEQFNAWIGAALDSGLPEPGAMVLATAGADGAPSARTVLLRGVDERGFVFYTNADSRKGRELAANPRAALVFPWVPLHRQVVVSGHVAPVSEQQSDAYWASRPLESRLSAAASPQSAVVPSRETLDAARAALAAAGGEVPRPANWHGFRVDPESVEFWQGRPHRFHDRLRYRLDGSAWRVERLAP